MKKLGSLPSLIVAEGLKTTHTDFLNYPDGNGGWTNFTGPEVVTYIRELTLGLVDIGVARGERVGLIAPPSPEWVIVDLAIQAAGAVSVPIFKKISPESYRHEIKDSGMRHLFIGHPDEIPMAVEHGEGRAELITFGCCTDNERFTDLLERGRRRHTDDPGEFDRLLDAVTRDDLCTIIYTSGSTGLPKGVELTQNNLLSQIEATEQRFDIRSDTDVALSLLPLAHIFERMVVYFYLSRGVRIYFVDDPKKLTAYAQSAQPTIMTVVPRLLEKVHERIVEKAEEKRGLAGKLARSAIARAGYRSIDAAPSVVDRIYNGLVYRKFRAALGGRIRVMISGSAKAAPELLQFFVNVGLDMYEGYGLTETSPVVAANYPGHRKIGTVGPLFPEIEVNIAEDGEVLVRGPNVMRGYHNRPDATAETIVDGWLHTGDLGSMDEDGYLTISGRKKELFKKSTGEYVPPAPIEKAIAEHPAVDTAVIIADNRAYVTALLFPDIEKISRVRSEHGFLSMSDREFLDSRYLREDILRHIEDVNRRRHHCEKVVRFELLDHAPTIDSGELTPTMKVRRQEIERIYRDKIEGMYKQIGGSQ
jgi:long-chain acyl-CoA synthetase